MRFYLGNRSLRCSRLLLLAQLYLLLPWSRTFLHPCSRPPSDLQATDKEVGS